MVLGFNSWIRVRRHASVGALVLLGMLAAAGLSGCNTTPSTPALREQADRFYERSEFAPAAERYAQVVARYPGDWQAQHRLGRSYLELGRVRDARVALEVAHTQRPDSPEVADALAEAMFRQGDDDRLFAFLRERAQETQTPRAYLRLGRYALQSGDPDTAKTAIDTAIELDNGQSVEPYLIAADFAERVQNQSLAIRRLRQAYGIDPQDERVIRRLRGYDQVPGPTIALPPGR